jgi:hypothetical protein
VDHHGDATGGVGDHLAPERLKHGVEVRPVLVIPGDVDGVPVVVVALPSGVTSVAQDAVAPSVSSGPALV